MAKTFFKNFNEAMNVPNFPFSDPYNGAGIPQLEEKRNTRQWKNRVAVPFSYIPEEGGFRRVYGTLYVPGNEAKKIKKDGTVKTDDIDIYGAELESGTSLTANGFRNLFDKYSRPTQNTFRVETQAIDEATNDQAEKPFLRAQDGPFFKNLREVLGKYQKFGDTTRREK